MHSSTGIRRAAGLLLGGGLVLLSLGAHSGSAVTPGSKAASMDACVAPTSEMRRNHMDYLKHDRDATVHKGIRDIRNSLAGCVDCHATKGEDGAYQPVNAQGQFCAGCHEFAAVSLACFQCHRKIPAEQSSGLSPLTGGSPGEQGRHFGLLQDSGETQPLTPSELTGLYAITRGN